MKTKNKSNLLLIELILAVLFFSLASSICVRVIFSAYEVSRKNSVLTKATITGDSMVSILKEKDMNTVSEIINKLYPSSQINGDEINIFLDKNFKDTSIDSARYYIRIVKTDKEYLRNIVLRVIDNNAVNEDNKTIYSLHTSNFMEGGF